MADGWPPETPLPRPQPRRAGGLPWHASDAPHRWWSPTPATRVVESGKTPPIVELDTTDSDPRVARDGSDWAEALDAARGWLRGQTRSGWRATLRRVVTSAPVALCLLVLVVWLVVQGGSALRWWVMSLSTQGVETSHRATPISSPAAPAATATLPTQTELDGVIIFENLDTESPVSGDVSVTAANGTLLCRNAPRPNSTWFVQLDPGGKTAVPCIIPISSPATLPPHTFRKVVSGSGGTGLLLVDNPYPFQGALFLPTPVPSATPAP